MKEENDTTEVSAMEIAPHSSFSPHPSSLLPVPNAPISVRVGTREDVPFIDALQKQFNKALGFFPRAQLEGYLDNGWVLVAEMDGSPVGYVASRDRYLKRDELGVIYQLCVSPGAQRGLIGASLIKEVFERSAYGCRLYCCWCAQDLAANKFWEALGFQAIAFRGGSAKKSRTHIFWQRRVRANDEQTRPWFPAKTEGGALREDRIVLPIPPGFHWSEPMPVLKAGPREKVEKAKAFGPPPASLPKLVAGMIASPLPPTKVAKARVQFGPPGAAVETVEETKALAVVEQTRVAMPERIAAKVESSKASKVDPRLMSAARDLRDRYLEHASDAMTGASDGKYDVTRALDGPTELPTEFIEPARKRLAA